MKTYSIKRKDTSTVKGVFQAPEWTEVQEYSIAFGNEDLQLAESMHSILKSMGVKAEFSNRLLPTITLRYNEGDYPKHYFKRSSKNILVIKEDRDESYVRE